MLGKHSGGHHKRSGGGLTGILRMFLSLIIMAILGLGLLQAYRSFSGIDPLKLDPNAIASNLLSSEKLIDFLTGVLTVSPSESLNKAKGALVGDQTISDTPSSDTKPQANEVYKFAVIGDPHIDVNNLKKALAQAKAQNVKFIIGIGDNSDVGTIDQLSNIKEQYDLVGLPYYMLPGDRDFWETREKKISPAISNFRSVFGSDYQSFAYGDTRFILIDNGDNYQGLDSVQLNWLESELKNLETNPSDLVFAFTSTPLFHPSSDHVMGKVEPKLKSQAEHLRSILKKAGVAEVLSADTHQFSRFIDPQEDLKMTTVGAVTSDRNPQTPRFTIVAIFDDGSYNIQEVEVK